MMRVVKLVGEKISKKFCAYLENVYFCIRIRYNEFIICWSFRNNLDFVIVFNVNRNDEVSFRFFL